MKEQLTKLLNSYASVSLDEIESVNLMDRTDTKFVLRVEQLLPILSKLSDCYKVLEIGRKRTGRYETIYFDTPDFKLYHQHQNKKLNRNKIRIRKYLDSGLSFLEIKHKNNRGRTVKERIKSSVEADGIWGEKEKEFLLTKANMYKEEIQPSLWVYYTRTTLVSQDFLERVTIDTELNYGRNKELKRYTELAIVEVKQGKLTHSSILSAFKEHSIREGSISKYCLGIISTIPGIKQNNFKKSILSINKLLYATIN